MKILITGGHLTPALSFIDYVQDQHPQDKLVFVGREFSQDALQQEAVEHYEVNKRGVPFIVFSAVRLGPVFFKQILANSRVFYLSVKQARAILKKQRPLVLVSFGGYLAAPFALAAWAMRIPVITHEQTLTVGLANRLIGRLAKKIAISFPQTAQSLPAHKTVLTGNLLRAGVFKVRHPRPKWLPEKIKLPLVLVMGGNQGSLTINKVIANTLPELLTDWTIIHQCGKPTDQHNYLEILEREKKRQPKNLQANYFIREWLDETDLFWIYNHAFCAISRSGANTTQELAAVKLPSVLIPLPHAHGDEQHKRVEPLFWNSRLSTPKTS
jgi:UDP-N-acetylglucosamine--N-acetylmuramyl-(pentapeptide) pyrophosphoryl-undecaprenol N-acetylglucosamine transferase